MQYIEAPDPSKPLFKSVFLAGGISNCPDWQKVMVEALKDLDVSLYNPRRAQYDTLNPLLAEEQITWEYERLHTADLISFWFAEGSLNPIVLFEFGAALERKTPIVVGADPGYPRAQDVHIQAMLRRSDLIIHSSLQELVKAVRVHIHADEV